MLKFQFRIITIIGFLIAIHSQCASADTAERFKTQSTSDLDVVIYDNQAYITNPYMIYEGKENQGIWTGGQEEITIPETVKINDKTYTVVGFYLDYIYTQSEPSECFVFPRVINLPSTMTKYLEVLKGKVGEKYETWYNLLEFLNSPYAITKECEEINIAPGGEYSSYKGIVYNTDETKALYAPEGMTHIKEFSPKATTIVSQFGNPSLEFVAIGNNITTIEDYAFYQCKNLKEVSFGSSIKKIGECSFMWCENLQTVKRITASIDDRSSVTGGIIDTEAFFGCENLTFIELPDRISTISEDAFEGCPIKKLSLPWSMKYIPDLIINLFPDLQWLELPGCLYMLNPNNFNSHPNMEVVVPEDAETIEEFDGAIYTKGLKALLLAPYNIKEYVAPAATESIQKEVFMDNKTLTSVNLNNVTNFGADVFKGCTSLTSVCLSEAIKNIDPRIFVGCNQLAKFEIPADAEYMEVRDGLVYSKGCETLMLAPYRTSSFVAPTELREITDYVFDGNDYLRSVSFNEGLEKIGVAAFRDCSKVIDIILPSTLKELGNHAFSFSGSNNLASRTITLPEGLGVIPEKCFEGNVISSINWPESLTTLRAKCFNNVKWDEGMDFVFPASLSIIENGAFGGSAKSRVGKLSFGTLRKLGNEAMSSLVPAEIYCGVWTPPVCGTNVFASEAYTQSELYVPQGAEQLYYDTNPWSNFVKIKGHEYVGITTVESDSEASITVSGGELMVTAPEGTAIEVYTTDGQRVITGESSLNVQLAKGMYIVRAGRTSRKIIL